MFHATARRHCTICCSGRTAQNRCVNKMRDCMRNPPTPPSLLSPAQAVMNYSMEERGHDVHGDDGSAGPTKYLNSNISYFGVRRVYGRPAMVVVFGCCRAGGMAEQVERSPV